MQIQHFLITEMVEAEGKPDAHINLPPPKSETWHDVFTEAMLEDSLAHQRRSPLDWVTSIGVHLAILATLLILPLYFTAGLDFHSFNLTFLAPPMIPAPPPPAPMRPSSALRSIRNVPAHVFTPRLLTAPTFIPKAVATSPSAGEAGPPDESLGGVPGGVPGGQVGGVLGGVLGGVWKNVPRPAQPAAAEGPKTPIRVGGLVKPPKLLYGPSPDYPVLARQSRLSGIVVIEAVIDERGNVTGMRVVSGHPLLVPAALSAVAKRKYEPTILDGEPTPVDLRVEVTFSFTS